MKFTIYTQQKCSFCIKAKELLNEQNMTFEEIEVTKDNVFDIIDFMNEEFGIPQFKTVPQIYVHEDGVNRYIGGYTELEQWMGGREEMQRIANP